MTPPNPDPTPTITAILALLDAASAIVQLPADVRRVIDYRTVQYLLDNAKALDWLLAEKDEGGSAQRVPEDEVQAGAGSNPSSSILHPSSLNPPNGPKRPQTKARPPKTPAKGRTPVLPPVFPATANGNGNGHAVIVEAPSVADDTDGPPHPSNRLSFDEFDRLCRAEMKRLSMDGRMPNAKLWDSERSPGLPTLGAVMFRYKVRTLIGLAGALGLEPPLTAKNYTINQNGANAIYREELTP